MAYLSVALLLVLSPLIIPVLVTAVHAVRAWSGTAGKGSVRLSVVEH